jgi:transcriptional regulator with GAF, ATPase, and Fis domain
VSRPAVIPPDTPKPEPKPQAIPIVTDLKNIPDPSIPVLEQVAKAKREAERAAILAALKTANWNRRRAAVLLRIDYKALLYKMKRLSIKKEKPNPTLVRAAAASIHAVC